MLAYRIDKRKYLDTLLQGIPGEISDFRWNTRGHPIMYASASRSLALLEKCGNMSFPFNGLPPSLIIAVLELADREYRRITASELPEGWDDLGGYLRETQQIGDYFSASEELALLVPSAIIPEEYNILINPGSVRIDQVKVSIEEINPRLLDQRP